VQINGFAEEIIMLEENFNYWFEVATIVLSIATVIVSVVALTVSVRTAWVQIKLQQQEWRPYLSYIKTEIEPGDDFEEDELSVNFKLHFKNVGKCILRYEFKKLNITFYESTGECTKNNINPEGINSQILSVNAEIVQSSTMRHVVERQQLSRAADFYNAKEEFDLYQGPLDVCNLVDCGLHELICFEIDFIVEYWKVDNPNDKYKLAYFMLVNLDEHGNCVKRYLKTDAN